MFWELVQEYENCGFKLIEDKKDDTYFEEQFELKAIVQIDNIFIWHNKDGEQYLAKMVREVKA